MRVVVVEVLGQAPRFQSFPDPVATQGEAVIRVRATGLHPIVKAIASGSHYSAAGEVPVVPGLDGVGTRADGRRVYFAFVRKPWKTMAETAAAPRSMCLCLAGSHPAQYRFDPDGQRIWLCAAGAGPGRDPNSLLADCRRQLENRRGAVWKKSAGLFLRYRGEAGFYCC